MLSENQSEACARCKAEYRKPLEDKIKRLQTENQNLKATAQIAVTAGESLKKELEAVKEDLKNCFIAGYEQGHNDTVESVYGSAEDIYEDIKNELLKGGNDGMATRLSVE